ncbi:MAG: peptidylprolyl isomerase, partial [Pseudomonadota bacterium]|nr:peptidylprolyl isomerase [Pseudomonadota bacterium]
MANPLRIMTPLLLTALTLLMPASRVLAQSNDQPASDPLPVVRMVTSEGAIELQLRPDVAPDTVANFLQYARDGFFDGTIFHRVIPGFMIQGGGFTGDLSRKSTRAPIRNEAKNTLPNLRGTVAMARTSAPDSATSQF